jgi:hypothetical protein
MMAKKQVAEPPKLKLSIFIDPFNGFPGSGGGDVVREVCPSYDPGECHVSGAASRHSKDGEDLYA